MLSKNELVEGIRFAGRRAADAAQTTADWDHVLGNGWTSHQMFSHVAATAGAVEALFPLLDTNVLNGMNVDAVAAGNADTISKMAKATKDEVVEQIRTGHDASASFIESCDEADLNKTVSLGGYSMTKGKIVGQIWINHAIAHAYDASARWPLA